MEDFFRDYKIVSMPFLLKDGHWAVCAKILRTADGITKEAKFLDKNGPSYILEIEAAKEGINMARNLINRNLVGF